MAINLKTSLAFMFITSLMVCFKVKITAKNSPDSSDSNYWTEFTVSYYDDTKEDLVMTFDSIFNNQNSHTCLTKNTMFFLRLQYFFQDIGSKKKFEVSVDSVPYKEKDANDIADKSIDGRNLCFTWGTWIADNNKGKQPSKIFFNIITDKAVIEREYLFIIFATVNDNVLRVYYQVHKFHLKKEEEEKRKGYYDYYLIAFDEETKDDCRTKVTFLDDERYTGNGNGNFLIPRIVQSNEVTAIDEAIRYAEKTISSRKMDVAKLNKANIIFRDGGFELFKTFDNFIKKEIKILI